MALLRWKFILGCSFALTVFGIFYLGYFCRGPNCAFRKGNPSVAYKSNYDAYFEGKFLRNQFSIDEVDKEYDLDLEDQDVVVFLHIQKTGGTTFGKHLVEDLDIDPPCECIAKNSGRKRCDCLTKNREVWLFSRYSTGWKCGLHADWTELKDCVDSWFQTEHGKKNRRYFYITILRDPVQRFLSEWIHVSKRRATWKTASLKCNGREATLDEVPFCFNREDWGDVSLEEFMACKHNLAINRQTRMLANLSKVNCYNLTGMTQAGHDKIMLDSAKENLKDLAYFGLMEFQNYSQFLFEHTLHIHFLTDFQQYNSTHSSRDDYSPDTLQHIAAINYLDIELYQYAKDLFIQRSIQAYVDEGLTVPEQLKHHLDLTVGIGDRDASHGDLNQAVSASARDGIERTGDQANDQFTQGSFERDSDQMEFNHDDGNRQDGKHNGGVATRQDGTLVIRGDRKPSTNNQNRGANAVSNTKQSVLVDNVAAQKLQQSGLLKPFSDDSIGNPPLSDTVDDRGAPDKRTDSPLAPHNEGEGQTGVVENIGSASQKHRRSALKQSLSHHEVER